MILYPIIIVKTKLEHKFLSFSWVKIHGLFIEIKTSNPCSNIEIS